MCNVKLAYDYVCMNGGIFFNLTMYNWLSWSASYVCTVV